MKPAGFGYEPYRPRAITFEGVRAAAGHRVKLYAIVYGGRPFERRRFEEGLEAAFAVLPPPAPGAGRPGLAFAIAHQGRGGDYVVLSWWERENELPTRTFVRRGETWGEARSHESFCVWDLQVIWHERGAYVETVLAGLADEAGDAYLGRHFEAPAGTVT